MGLTVPRRAIVDGEDGVAVHAEHVFDDRPELAQTRRALTGHRKGCYEKSGMRLRCAASSSIVSSEGRDS